MSDVIPAWLRQQGFRRPPPDPFWNPLLRFGEVVSVTWPEDPASTTKRFVEYDVLVAHHENGTASTRIYHACLLANDLAGLADRSYRALRVATSTGAGDDILAPSHGSKVGLLCIHGEQLQPVIVCGGRDDQDTDVGRRVQGACMEWEFNGVNVLITDDGGLKVTRKGATDAEGAPDAGRASGEGVGAEVAATADGSFSIRTGDGKCAVKLDRPAGRIEVTADTDVVVDAAKIHLKAGAGQRVVRGDAYRGAQKRLHDATAGLGQQFTLLAAAAVGPLAAFKAQFILIAQLYAEFEAASSEFLSDDVLVK